MLFREHDPAQRPLSNVTEQIVPGVIQTADLLRRSIVVEAVGQRREASEARVTSSVDDGTGVEQVSSVEDAGPSFGRFVGLRSGISRRMFLGRGSMIAGVAAAVATVPGLGALLTTGEQDVQDAPAFDGAASEAGGAATGDLSQPVVAHVVNASTGEINLYQGTQLITTRNPALAQALARLAAAK
jgi:hypothetical protein